MTSNMDENTVQIICSLFPFLIGKVLTQRMIGMLDVGFSNRFNSL
ncbi:hypothetical protein HMPREF0381_1613 [Lachnoanaerobaculum saburreum DSM 3986]|uniref:Uncharacterized protein n=1 Tax=Lachnoanaerobaculum saburreum DSM 3986 TaxID=887325 RepID=E6LNS8_9FIRM|nr:hypothetical protein HMPREF0381_1613 [Lachnoanaerobaculum saburreum DSM 3986]